MSGAVRTLHALLPQPPERDLLRACVDPEEESAGAAWRRWRASVHDPVAVLSQAPPLRSLLPLALEAARRAGEQDAALLTYLRAARARERVRFEMCAAIALEASSLLTAEQIAHVVLGDVALAVAYDDPAVRHCHSLALLVETAALKHARVALERGGLRRTDRVTLQHRSGLPVQLRRTAVPAAFRPLTLVEVARTAQRAGFADGGLRVPAPAHRLVETLAGVLAGGRRGDLWWPCDLAQLCRCPLDWDLALAQLERSGLALAGPLLAQLRDSLGAPVPERVPRALAALAGNARVRARARASVWTLAVAARSRAGENRLARTLVRSARRG